MNNVPGFGDNFGHGVEEAPKKVIPKFESIQGQPIASAEAWAMAPVCADSSPQARIFSRESKKNTCFPHLCNESKIGRAPVTRSAGAEGLIDGAVASWTRKAPKTTETTLREIGPRTLCVLEGAERNSFKQTERLKAVRAAVWLESKVRLFDWTPPCGLKKAASYDRRIASLAMNGAKTLDDVRHPGIIHHMV